MNPIHSRLLKAFLSAASSFYGGSLITIAVFGSVARGTATAESDIDVVIVATNLPRGRVRRIDAFLELERLLKMEFEEAVKAGFHPEWSPVIKTPEEVLGGSLLFLDMIEDAHILFDRDDFFRRFLDDFRKRLDRLGAKKIVQGERWYWDLKPDYKPGEVFEI